MQFHRVNNTCRVSRITGPTHNFLELELDEAIQSPLFVEQVGPPPETGQERLDQEVVVEHILGGILEASRAYGPLPRLSRIRYVASDSKPEAVYHALAFALIERYFRT
ncbi:MAG: hypothetical protein IPK50_06920 [Fibrobacterota bacterium]|nr:hypothetical protein [Fibrobacterota bacterium]QQS06625.1 MAG: hypothetical protein IPK50_06920 [Fibrobacterota bacterium]